MKTKTLWWLYFGCCALMGVVSSIVGLRVLERPVATLAIFTVAGLHGFVGRLIGRTEGRDDPSTTTGEMGR